MILLATESEVRLALDPHNEHSDDGIAPVAHRARQVLQTSHTTTSETQP